jgi:hypothetical protein
MRCPNGSNVQEYDAIFENGVWYRRFVGSPRAGWTKLSLGREEQSVRLAGYVVFEDSVFDYFLGKRDVRQVNGTAGKDGANYVGKGTFGDSDNCSLTVTNKN